MTDKIVTWAGSPIPACDKRNEDGTLHKKTAEHFLSAGLRKWDKDTKITVREKTTGIKFDDIKDSAGVQVREILDSKGNPTGDLKIFIIVYLADNAGRNTYEIVVPSGTAWGAVMASFALMISNTPEQALKLLTN